MKSTDDNYKDYEYVFDLYLSAFSKRMDVTLPENSFCRLHAIYVR